jgi:hypothetical protein
MRIGWSDNTHNSMAMLALSYLPFSEIEKTQILIGIQIPDKQLYKNFLDHYQTPAGIGNAINKIIEFYNKRDLVSLGQAIHFIQDICNPLHTTFSNEAIHSSYEDFADFIPYDFIPKDIKVLSGDLKASLQKLVKQVNGYLPELVDSYKSGNQKVVSLTSYLKNLATEATFELAQNWIGRN